MSKKNEFVFIGLQIVAWIIFVGLCIEAGALLVNFFFSLYKPEFVKNLYLKLDLSLLYQESRIAFFGTYGLILTISILKSVLFYLVIHLMQKMDLAKPFNTFVEKQITLISYITLSIGLICSIAKVATKNLIVQNLIPNSMNKFWEDGQAFILMGAVIFIIATIFKKGIELQNENDLTV